jgi:DNA polymerase I
MAKKIFLLDALALIYRAYFGLSKNPRITSYGKNTNAQFGFTTTLLDLIKKENPTHLGVCFDTHAPTERHTDFTDYKANRQEAPEDLIAALPDIKNIIEGFNIPVIECDGYEADDIIGTLALQAAAKGYEVYMVTPDKDYGQLVSENIFMYRPPAFGNKEEILGVKEVCEKWSIKRVDQVIDILGLMGDAVDNIPGIKGVGEKTAAKLLAEYDTLENVLANAANIKGAMGEKIKAGVEDAILSKKLATIITNVPVEFNEEHLELSEWDKPALSNIFNELEFKTLGTRILGADFSPSITTAPAAGGQLNLFDAPASETSTTVNLKPIQIENDDELNSIVQPDFNITNVAHEYIAITNANEAAQLVKELLRYKEICIDTETTGTDPNNVDIVGLSLAAVKGKAYYVPITKENAVATLGWFSSLFTNKNIVWIGQNIKYDLIVLKWYGVSLAGALFDTMLAHYLIEPDGKRSMDMLSAKYLNYAPISIETLIGKKGKNQGNMKDVALEQITEYAAEDADITLQLKQVLAPQLEEKKVLDLFNTVENPLIPVLLNMEFEGIQIDEPFLRNYSKELEREAKQAEEKVYQLAGVRFNLASPKQLGEVLFDKLQIDPKAKKTKTGQYATGEDVLQKLAKKHEIVDYILAFREFTKLRNTYVDALPELINPKTGRVHTSYNQAIAVTGRLSSNNPNLQNIPIRTDRGREIRKAFIPRAKDYILMSADYSQIELRIVAAICGDEALVNAFKEGKDIHTSTAAKVFNVSEAEVTKEMRYKAKSVNFGLIYGQGAFGLSENLGISRTEAKEIIDNYFVQFAALKKYMDETIQFAQEHGYVQTILGRKRWLRDINSSNATVRSFAERNAINSPIQGTAADMIKLAMININNTLQQQPTLKSKMVLQVHDELVFDVHKDEIEILKPIILNGMEQALVLPNGVPVVAEVGMGSNWLEAH